MALMSALHESRRKPIAACLASIFALTAPVTASAFKTWPVTSCLDDFSTGTLRSVISAVTTQSGDVVDLSSLNCPGNTMTLGAGVEHIPIYQSSLTILGPTASTLTIDGSGLPTYVVNYSNIFYHRGNGTLTVAHLTLTNGHQSHRNSDSFGGCIDSVSNVSLIDVTLEACSAYSQNQVARGGAVFAVGNVTLTGGTIDGNSAHGGLGGRGGGIYALGNVSMQFSTVSGNTAGGGSAPTGGGVQSLGNFVSEYSTISGNKVLGAGGTGGGLVLSGVINAIATSTVSGNTSYGDFGGVKVFGSAPGRTFQISNSTISNNDAADTVGGLYVNSNNAKFYNSTIAFNTAGNGGASPGVQLSAATNAVAVTLQSTLISNNTYGTFENDLDAAGANSVTFNSGNILTPANNLVRVTFLGGLPIDTSISCPHLGRLRDNGGLTQTHALLSHSAAIDAGNIFFSLGHDQRGPESVNGELDYLRVSGGKADIGAYEVQQSDIVFDTDFEDCAPLPF